MTDMKRNEMLFDAILKVALTEAFENDADLAIPEDKSAKEHTAEENDKCISIFVGRCGAKRKGRVLKLAAWFIAGAGLAFTSAYIGARIAKSSKSIL